MATSLQLPLSSIPKVAVVERFGCNLITMLTNLRSYFSLNDKSQLHALQKGYRQALQFKVAKQER